jgi:hypothetical protein
VVSLREFAEEHDAGGPPLVLHDPRRRVAVLDLRGERARVEYAPTVESRWPVLVALVVLNALDVLSTVAVLAAGGTEGNPLMRPLIDGVWPAIIVKSLVLVVVAVLLGRCSNSRRIRVMMAVTTGWYIAVVSWNVTILGFA